MADMAAIIMPPQVSSHSIPHRNPNLQRIIHRHLSRVLSDYRLISNAHTNILIPYSSLETQTETIIGVQIILPLDSGNALDGILIP